jgi:predicted Zn-dependent peptidase
MPRGPEAQQVPTVETPQKGQRWVDMEFEAQPVSMLGWHIPSVRDPDFRALDALGDVLGTGRTSRLYKSLVVEKKLAVAVEAFDGLPGQKYPNLFGIFVVPTQEHTLDECVAAIEEELAKVREAPVGDEELQVVKTRTRANFVRGLRGNMELAQSLALHETINGGWKTLFEEPAEVAKLTPKDLQRVAKKYLVDTNLTRGDIVGVGQSGDHKLVKKAGGEKSAPPKKSTGDEKDE